MSDLLSVSVKTLDREGILVAQRSPTNRRFYTQIINEKNGTTY